MSKTILVSATPLEHGGLTEINGYPIYQVGIGKINSAMNLTEILYEEKPELVINFGSCGNLKDHKVGEVMEVGTVYNNIDVLTEETNGVENPIIQFCVNFADNYTDTLTTQNTLSKEEYTDKIKFLISKLETILLNDNMVSYVNKEDGDYNLKLSDNKKSYEQTRFWNQGVAKQLLESFLSNLNKGL